jgi:hypothetical protein
MNLGNLLKREGGTPVTGRRVQIKVIKNTASPIRLVEAELLLHPVDEQTRLECRRAAERAVRQAEEQEQADVPDLRSEYVLALLQASARDVEDPDQPFFDNTRSMRIALVQEQVEVLAAEYFALLESEYPEVASQRAQKRIEEQARNFSAGGPQSSTRCSHCGAALTSGSDVPSSGSATQTSSDGLSACGSPSG